MNQSAGGRARTVASWIASWHYQARLAEFAEREGIRFVDLFDALDGDDPRPVFWDWDPHLTPLGHAVVAETLLAATTDVIGSLAVSTGK
jgi:hypothetical protein